mmetsp:Transcript_97537/g.309356  ORF Transcript_97537/g.309356 Transcript_97537/m.309356 type:complete len:306 (+) Transcript_97537:223-1140(+)
MSLGDPHLPRRPIGPPGPPGSPPGGPTGSPPGMPPPGALVMPAMPGTDMGGMLPVFGIIATPPAFGSPRGGGIMPGPLMPGPGMLSGGGGSTPGGGILRSGLSIGGFAFAMSPPSSPSGGTPALASIGEPTAGPERESRDGIAAFASMPSFGRPRPSRAPRPGATPVPVGSARPPGSAMPPGSVGLMPWSRPRRPPGAVAPAMLGEVPGIESGSESPGSPATGSVPGLVLPRPGSLGSAGSAGSLAAAAAAPPPASFCKASAGDALSLGGGCVRGRLGITVWSARKRTPARFRSDSVSVTPSSRL